MGKGIIEVGVNQTYQFLILLHDDAFGYIRHIVQFVFYLFRVDILTARTKEHVLAASLDAYVAFGIHQGKVSGVQPAVFVEYLYGGLVVLVVTQHDIGTTADNLSRNVFGIG